MRPTHDLEPAFANVLTTLRAREGLGPPLFSAGERIVAASRRFARSADDCARFATALRLFSVNPAIAPLEPGESKAVLFAGDVLHAAGFVAPIEAHRYLPAEHWVFSPLLASIAPGWSRPGDLLVWRGHLEVITSVSSEPSRLTTLGARNGGLVEDDDLGRRIARARGLDVRCVAGRHAMQILRVSVQGQ